MNEKARNAVPTWFWVVAALASLWQAVGCFFYLMQVSMDAADYAALPEAQADAFRGMAAWQWSVFAVAVWSGLLGAVGLLLRRRWAIWALLVSLVAAAVQYGYTFLATPILQTMDPGEALGLPIVIIVVGALLVVFSRMSIRRGWLH